MRNYVQKSESIDDSDMSNSNDIEDLAYSSCQALDKVATSPTSALLSGTGFILREVRDKVHEIMHPN